MRLGPGRPHTHTIALPYPNDAKKIDSCSLPLLTVLTLYFFFIRYLYKVYYLSPPFSGSKFVSFIENEHSSFSAAISHSFSPLFAISPRVLFSWHTPPTVRAIVSRSTQLSTFALPPHAFDLVAPFSLKHQGSSPFFPFPYLSPFISSFITADHPFASSAVPLYFSPLFANNTVRNSIYSQLFFWHTKTGVNFTMATIRYHRESPSTSRDNGPLIFPFSFFSPYTFLPQDYGYISSVFDTSETAIATNDRFHHPSHRESPPSSRNNSPLFSPSLFFSLHIYVQQNFRSITYHSITKEAKTAMTKYNRLHPLHHKLLCASRDNSRFTSRVSPTTLFLFKSSTSAAVLLRIITRSFCYFAQTSSHNAKTATTKYNRLHPLHHKLHCASRDNGRFTSRVSPTTLFLFKSSTSAAALLQIITRSFCYLAQTSSHKLRHFCAVLSTMPSNSLFNMNSSHTLCAPAEPCDNFNNGDFDTEDSPFHLSPTLNATSLKGQQHDNTLKLRHKNLPDQSILHEQNFTPTQRLFHSSGTQSTPQQQINFTAANPTVALTSLHAATKNNSILSAKTSNTTMTSNTINYLCPLCDSHFDSAYSLKEHINNSASRDEDMQHSRRQALLAANQLNQYRLFVCPLCDHTKICINQRGLSTHTSHQHHCTPTTQPSFACLLTETYGQKVSCSETWAKTFKWLSNLNPQPMPFRKSLFAALSTAHKMQVLDVYILLLNAFQTASLHCPRNDALVPKDSSLEPFVKLLILFEGVILAPPDDTEPSQYKHLVSQRLTDFKQGLFPLMYERAISYHVPPHPLSTTTSSLHIDHSVTQAVRDFRFHSAFQGLDPQPIAPITDDHLVSLLNMHPPPHTKRPPFTPYPPTPPSSDPKHFCWDQVLTTIRSSPKGKAAGAFADSPDFLIAVADRKTSIGSTLVSGLQLIQHFLSVLLNHTFSRSLWSILTTNYVLAFYKDYRNRPTKIRPIGIGTAWRRLLARHVVKSNLPLILQHLSPFQLGIGVSGGTELLAIYLQGISDMHITRPSSFLDAQGHPSLPTRCIVKFDLANMFNNASRQEAFEEIQEYFPHLLFLFDCFCPPNGNVCWYRGTDNIMHSFQIEEGFSQGCPFSPFFAALVLHRLMRQLDVKLHERAQIRLCHGYHGDDNQGGLTKIKTYLDDGGIAASLLDVKFIFDFIAKHGPSRGLKLAEDKCSILLSTNGISPLPYLNPPSLCQELQYVINTYCQGQAELSGLQILGHSIGHEDYKRAHLLSFIPKLQDSISLMHTHLSHPSIKLRLFQYCIQTRVPYHQYTDASLSSTNLSFPTSHSTFISSINDITRQFLCNILGITELPNHSWAVATLPLHLGGLALSDFSTSTSLAFVRPLLRAIRQSLYGVSILDFANTKSASPNLEPTPILLQIPLANEFSKFFMQWEHSTLPLFTKFREVATHFLEHQKTPTLSLHDLVAATDQDPLRLLKTMHHSMQATAYSSKLSSFSSDFVSVESSLRSSLTSLALCSLDLQVAANRLPTDLFNISLRRKLRIPLNLPPNPTCPCSKLIDAYGDHFFNCHRASKSNLHNRLRDTLFFILSRTAPYAGFATSSSDLALEPSSLLPAYPDIRPADVAIRLPPGTTPSSSPMLLIDLTCIPMPSPLLNNPQTPISVVEHHEAYENRKFTGRSRTNAAGIYIRDDDIISTINHQNYTLLPFTFDPGGFFGPLATAFTFGSKHPTTFILPRPHRSTSHLKHTSNALLASQRTHENIGKLNSLLARADLGYRENHGSSWFTHSYTAATPSAWAMQTLGQNLLIATSQHIREALSRLNPFSTSPHPLIACASLKPRYEHPTHSVSNVFYQPNPTLRHPPTKQLPQPPLVTSPISTQSR